MNLYRTPLKSFCRSKFALTITKKNKNNNNNNDDDNISFYLFVEKDDFGLFWSLNLKWLLKIVANSNKELSIDT